MAIEPALDGVMTDDLLMRSTAGDRFHCSTRKVMQPTQKSLCAKRRKDAKGQGQTSLREAAVEGAEMTGSEGGVTGRRRMGERLRSDRVYILYDYRDPVSRFRLRLAPLRPRVPVPVVVVAMGQTTQR